MVCPKSPTPCIFSTDVPLVVLMMQKPTTEYTYVSPPANVTLWSDMPFLLEGGGVRSPGAGATANGLSSTDNIWFRRAFALSWNTVQRCFCSKLKQGCKRCTPWYSTKTLTWHYFLWEGHIFSWYMCECDFIYTHKAWRFLCRFLQSSHRLKNTIRSLTLNMFKVLRGSFCNAM